MKLSKILGILCILIGLSFLFPIGLGQTMQTSDDQTKIGIFYYVWWEATNPNSWDSTCVDTPLLGWYDSNDPMIISQHLSSLEELGIDFVIISWWGTEDRFGGFTDMSAKEVFQVANNSRTNLKFAILVEPFDIENEVYDYDAIYNQIYNDFFLPYSSLYYEEDGNPLICFYNDPGYAPSLTDPECISFDSRFTCKIVGEEPYTQWMYIDLVKSVVRENQVSVTPRFDNSFLVESKMEFQIYPRFDEGMYDFERSQIGTQIDPRLDQEVYDHEWQKAIQLWQQGQVKTILISSWNEYYERTAIEPHFDASAFDRNPYLLYNKTQAYVEQLRQGKPISLEGPDLSIKVIPEYPSALSWFGFLTAFSGSIVVLKYRYRKREDNN